MDDDDRLNNGQDERRVALVTGASYGLGAEIAKTLAGDGFDVAVTELDAVDLAETVAAIEACAGARAAALQLDVRSLESIDSAVAETVAQLGRIDVLVSNAGVLIARPALDVTPEDWDEVMSVNARGCFFMAQRVARQMIEAGRGGSIINLASTFTTVGATDVAPYGISKATVGGITRHLAVEWAPHGIRVNAVAPGTVETKLRAARMAANPERREAGLAKIPLGRFGTPRDMAAAVAYLASPAAAYVNGHVLAVDGGMTIS